MSAIALEIAARDYLTANGLEVVSSNRENYPIETAMVVSGFIDLLQMIDSVGFYGAGRNRFSTTPDCAPQSLDALRRVLRIEARDDFIPYLEVLQSSGDFGNAAYAVIECYIVRRTKAAAEATQRDNSLIRYDAPNSAQIKSWVSNIEFRATKQRDALRAIQRKPASIVRAVNFDDLALDRPTDAEIISAVFEIRGHRLFGELQKYVKAPVSPPTALARLETLARIVNEVLGLDSPHYVDRSNTKEFVRELTNADLAALRVDYKAIHDDDVLRTKLVGVIDAMGLGLGRATPKEIDEVFLTAAAEPVHPDFGSW